jgi:hypothetical protein
MSSDPRLKVRSCSFVMRYFSRAWGWALQGEQAVGCVCGGGGWIEEGGDSTAAVSESNAVSVLYCWGKAERLTAHC